MPETVSYNKWALGELLMCLLVCLVLFMLGLQDERQYRETRALESRVAALERAK